MEDMYHTQSELQTVGNRKARSTSRCTHQTLEDGYNKDLLAVNYSKIFDRVDITTALQKLSTVQGVDLMNLFDLTV